MLRHDKQVKRRSASNGPGEGRRSERSGLHSSKFDLSCTECSACYEEIVARMYEESSFSDRRCDSSGRKIRQ